jgi:hypothetical protein
MKIDPIDDDDAVVIFVLKMSIISIKQAIFRKLHWSDRSIFYSPRQYRRNLQATNY